MAMRLFLLSMPGQALSYKIGQIKILQLGEIAKKELGAGFNIQEYHNIVLDPGCIPLEFIVGKSACLGEAEKS